MYCLLYPAGFTFIRLREMLFEFVMILFRAISESTVRNKSPSVVKSSLCIYLYAFTILKKLSLVTSFSSFRIIKI